MRKIVMSMLTGGTLLMGAAFADAGALTGIRTVGSGLNAKVEVTADASLTYVFFRKDATHWVVDLAKTDMGAVDASMDLGIPASTGLTVEKRQAGSIPITRVTVSVRPGVSLAVKPSADRKLLTLSFQSGVAPAASAKDDDLLSDLDAPAKAAEPAAGKKDDLDALLDTPVAAVPAKGMKDDLAGLDDLTEKAAPQAAASAAAAVAPVNGLLPAAEPVAAAGNKAPERMTGLDRELAALDEPVAPPAKAPAEPVMPEIAAAEPKLAVLKVKQPSVVVTPVAAAPTGVELGALTPEELGIASPELDAPKPVVKEEPRPLVKEEPKPLVKEEPKPLVKEEPKSGLEPAKDEAAPATIAVAEPGAAVAAGKKAGGSLKVEDNALVIEVDNFSTYKSFTLMEPTRLVIDMAGARASLKEAAAKIRLAGVKAVRFSQYPDKVRIVFDLPKGELPSYKVEKLEHGVKVLLQ